MATTNDKVRREAYRRSLTSTSSRDLTMASGSTEDLLLPRPVRSTSSSSSYAPLAPLNTTGNRLRSRSLVQRGVIDTSLTSPVDPTSSRLPTAIHESDTGSEDSSEVGPDTPVEHYTQGQPWSGGRAKGKAREVIEQAGDVVYSFAVPGPTPALERGRANSDVRVMASAIGGGHQAQPATATLAKPFAILLAAFVGSTCVAIVLIATVPTLSIPHSVADALAETRALRDYANTSYTAATHIFAVLCALFVYKQAFSVPGSVLLNVCFGALYGVVPATLVTCVLTAVGSLACYLMARDTAPVIRWAMPKAIEAVESRLPHRSQMSHWLLLARLFPLLPYSALNIAAGVLALPIRPFFWTLVLGSFPYNVVTTQLGDILASTISEQGGFVKLWTPALFVKLVAVTAISAAPVLLKSRLQAWLSPSIASTSTGRALPLPATGSPPLGTFNGQRRRLASVDADYFAVPNASTEYIPLS